jgi:hypothetical protein
MHAVSMIDHEDDPPFHFEIWRGPSQSFGEEPKAIYYVENHNGQCSYGELALDFQIAAKALLETYQQQQIGNWMAPVAHMIRQTLELRLKALLTSIVERDSAVSKKPLGQHNLLSLWEGSFNWLISNGYKIDEDARLARTIHLLRAFDAIDPSGDLFRFGLSRKTAFNKQKSYDRVGINCDIMERDFDAADGLLSHWDAVIFRIAISEEMGWVSDPYFDADDFPKASG